MPALSSYKAGTKGAHMKEYNLIFPFSKTGELTLIRTMPDGKNKGLFNGIGGNTETSCNEQFFDVKESKLIDSVHVMTIIMNGCTDTSMDESIKLHIKGHVYDHLKTGNGAKADQVTHKPTYDALLESLETEMDNITSENHSERKYVPGYNYFLQETFAAILREQKTKNRFPDFKPMAI